MWMPGVNSAVDDGDRDAGASPIGERQVRKVKVGDVRQRADPTG
jgi:hypothetical protein